MSPSLSYEIFPPRTATGRATLAASLVELRRIPPALVSVTYGAGGSDTDRSFEAVRLASELAEAPVAAHLTCVEASRDEVDEVMGDPGSLRPGRRGRADVHSPIDQHRVGVDDLGLDTGLREQPGEGHGHRRLATGRGTVQCHHRSCHVRHCLNYLPKLLAESSVRPTMVVQPGTTRRRDREEVAWTSSDRSRVPLLATKLRSR